MNICVETHLAMRIPYSWKYTLLRIWCEYTLLCVLIQIHQLYFAPNNMYTTTQSTHISDTFLITNTAEVVR